MCIRDSAIAAFPIGAGGIRSSRHGASLPRRLADHHHPHRIDTVTKPRLYSGMQPSADSLQIGNYIGALLQWRDLQSSYDAYFSVVDLHALTVAQDPAEAA